MSRALGRALGSEDVTGNVTGVSGYGIYLDNIEPCSKIQDPRPKSQEPRPKNQDPGAKSQNPRAKIPGPRA